MSRRTASLAALVAGAASAALTELAAAKLGPDGRDAAWGGGLVIAAGIYPLARRESPGSKVELATLAAAAALVGAAATRPPATRRRLLAAGWAAHALFDQAFHPEPADSRIPSWYPAMCAGYDLLGAGLLARPTVGA